jgi:hypothetical protein
MSAIVLRPCLYCISLCNVLIQFWNSYCYRFRTYSYKDMAILGGGKGGGRGGGREGGGRGVGGGGGRWGEEGGAVLFGPVCDIEPHPIGQH